MRRLLLSLLLSSVIYHLSSAVVSAQTRTSPLIIDHTSVALFDQIPDTYIESASQLNLMFRHASVGQNILEGLQCLAGERTTPRCLQLQDPKYDYSSWSFQNRGNPSWTEKVHDFVTQTQTQIDQHDVFMFKYCFIDYRCTDPQVRFNQLLNGQNTQLGMQNLYQWLSQNNYPDKQIVWWTIPTLMWGGDACGQAVNNLIRDHVRANNLILVDIADIESHDPAGNLITDPSDNEISFGPYCGEFVLPCRYSCHLNWPNEGLDCDGNLLSSAPDGSRILVAKALWVLMAQLAGWDPSGSITPPPLSPTLPASHDLDGDTDVDFLDYRTLLLNFNSSGLGNFNLTGFVDIFDLNTLISNL